jgi:hypothetical protein
MKRRRSGFFHSSLEEHFSAALCESTPPLLEASNPTPADVRKQC